MNAEREPVIKAIARCETALGSFPTEGWSGPQHPLTVLRLLADASAAIDDAMLQVAQYARRDGHRTEEIARACRVPVKMLEDLGRPVLDSDY